MANPTQRPVGPVLRSHSPSGRFYSSLSSNSFASSTIAFSSRSSSFFQSRSASPTRVNVYGSSLSRARAEKTTFRKVEKMRKEGEGWSSAKIKSEMVAMRLSRDS
ncbi:hypothetical protein L1887_19579 [Cichorium endivia]|nr:hypothetical protein L1887_19579 [Cichorium endivia]